ncbi:hypothetical protein ABZP36_003634 [Zizania latifolia]
MSKAERQRRARLPASSRQLLRGCEPRSADDDHADPRHQHGFSRRSVASLPGDASVPPTASCALPAVSARSKCGWVSGGRGKLNVDEPSCIVYFEKNLLPDASKSSQ